MKVSSFAVLLFVHCALASVVQAQFALDNYEWCWPWEIKDWTCPSPRTTTPRTTTTTDYPESTKAANTSESTTEQITTDTSTFSSPEPTESTTGASVSTTTENFSSTETFESTTDDPSPDSTTKVPDGDESALVLQIVVAITVTMIAAVCLYALYKSIVRFHYQRMPSNEDNEA